MAQTTRLSQLERDFYLRNTGGLGMTGATPFGTLQRTYYINYLNNPAKWNKNTPLDQLVIDWAKAYIVSLGATPEPGSYLTSAWRQLVVALGKTPARNITQNKRLFFFHAP